MRVGNLPRSATAFHWLGMSSRMRLWGRERLEVALVTTAPALVWRHFSSWLRTVRPGVCPSEMVVAVALRYILPELLADMSCDPNFVKFLRDRLDPERTKGMLMGA